MREKCASKKKAGTATRKVAGIKSGPCTQKGIPKEHAPVNLDGINQTCVHDIVAKNINVFYDEKIEKQDGKYNIPICINSSVEGVDFYNIKISNINVNGDHLTKENAIIEIDNVNNFCFE